MTSNENHIFNLKLIESIRTNDWASRAIKALEVNEHSNFKHTETGVLMPLWFIATQAIEFNRAEDLVLDYIKREWWFTHAA